MNFAQLIANITGVIDLSKAAKHTVSGIVLAFTVLLLLWSRGIAIPEVLWHTTFGVDSTWDAPGDTVVTVFEVALPGMASPPQNELGVDPLLASVGHGPSGAPAPSDTLRVPQVVPGSSPTWRELDSLRIENLRERVRVQRSRKADLDGRLSVRDSVVAHRERQLATLLLQYGTDLGSGSPRSAALASEIRGIEGEIDSVSTAGQRDRLASAGLSVSLQQLETELTQRESDFTRLSATGTFSGAIQTVVNALLALVLLGYVLGLVFLPVNRALMDALTNAAQGLFYGRIVEPNPGKVQYRRSVADLIEWLVRRRRRAARRTASKRLKKLEAAAEDLAEAEEELASARAQASPSAAAEGRVQTRAEAAEAALDVARRSYERAEEAAEEAILAAAKGTELERNTDRKTIEAAKPLMTDERAFEAMLPDSRRKRLRTKRLRRSVSFYIGKGVISRDEHEKIVADYYAFAELAASMIIPTAILLYLAATELQGRFYWQASVCAVVLAALLYHVPRRRDQYRDKLNQYIRGKLEKLEEAAGRKSKPGSKIDTGRTEASLSIVHERGERAHKLAEEAPEIATAIRELTVLARHLGDRVAGLNQEKALDGLAELVAKAEALAETGGLPADLGAELRRLLEDARTARGQYANDLARHVLEELGDEQKLANLAQRSVGALITDPILTAKLASLRGL